MKKELPLLAVIATLLMTSCQNGRNQFKDHFKEYSFKGPISDKDQTPITDGYQKTKLKVSSFEILEEEYNHNGYTETSVVRKAKIVIKEDTNKPGNLITEQTITTESDISDNGISYKTSVKQEIKEWYNVYAVYTMTTTTQDGKRTKDTNKVNTTYGATEYKDRYISKYFVDLWGDYYYKNDGTYAVINSEKDRRVSASQWGTETKEYVVSTKRQAVSSINKKYELTNYYSYFERRTNQDYETSEWFNSERLVKRSYKSTSYKYEAREKASIASLDAAWKKK